MNQTEFEIKDFSYLKGQNYDKAKKELAEPYYLMPTSIDGKSLIWTCDVNNHRVGVKVDKNISACVNELNEWLSTRPYFNKMLNLVRNHKDNDIREGRMFFVGERNQGVIHLYEAYILIALKVGDNKTHFLFEHITPILLEYGIESIGIGNTLYHLRDEKYVIL